MKQVGQLSDATAQLMRTHFTEGFEALAKVRTQIGAAPWAKNISSEYSGDMLRMSDADLRRIGQARFDNLELIWDYDAEAALRLKLPLLWVLAEQDRAAPIAATRSILSRLRVGIDTYLFPDTDHGMVEFRTDAEGNRVSTRITDGYLRLLADWIKQDVHGSWTFAQIERLTGWGALAADGAPPPIAARLSSASQTHPAPCPSPAATSGWTARSASPGGCRYPCRCRVPVPHG